MSAPNTSNLNTNDISEENETPSEASYSTLSTISSFKHFIENHVQPYKREYDALGTNYLCMDVPFDKIFCEDSPTYRDIQPKFAEPVVLEEFKIKENTRDSIGPSVRKPFLVPSTKWIMNDLELRKFEDSHERQAYLYYKAAQWCEVNKALAMDHRFPKPNPNILRAKYSKAHQKVARQIRKDAGSHRKGNILKDIESTHASLDSGDGVQEFENWKLQVEQVFNDITPIPELQKLEKHWQLKAEERRKMSDRPAIKKKKKQILWKRNIYPPLTLEDYIRKKRSLLPPLKPEALQTDILSGIWSPELMVNEFEITPLNYDSRLIAEEGPDPISWWVIHEAVQKCWQWLHSIPSNL